MTADPTEIVRALFDAFARRDVDAGARWITEDFEFWPQSTADRAGRSEPYRGVEGLREYQRDLERVWDDFTIDPGDLRVAASGVVAFGTAKGIAGGVEHAMPVIWVFKLRGGRASSVRVALTAAEVTAALDGDTAA